MGFNKITKQTQVLTSWKNTEDPSLGRLSFEINPDGSSSFIIVWNRSKQYWTSGSWDASSRTFSLIPEMRLNYIYNFSYATNENISYFTYSLYDPKIVSRFVLYVTGQVEQLQWMENTRQWNMFWSQPIRQCEVPPTCGAFGSCNDAPGLLCNCLMGFEPKSPRDWSLKDYSDGCSRKTNLHCGAEDRFLEMTNMLMPENKQSLEVRSVEKCGSFCLSNCSCTAYAYAISTGCLIWTGDLLGLAQLGEDDSGGRILYIKLSASELMHLKNGADKRSLIIAMVSAAAGLLAISFGYLLWKKTLGKKSKTETGSIGGSMVGTKINYGAGGGKNDTELPLFGLKIILAATDNFSEANKLGEGGFGPVYKEILPENQDVAIKRLSKKSGQGHQEFWNELELIAKLQQPNLLGSWVAVSKRRNCH